MATTWTTTLTGLNHSRAVAPNESVVELTWRVQATDQTTGQELAWDPVAYALTIIDDANIPRAGDELSGFLGSVTSSDWSAYFRCRKVDWKHLNDSFSVWECKARFTSKDVWCPQPHVYRTDTLRTRSVDMWHWGNPTSTQIANNVDVRQALDPATYVPVGLVGKPVKNAIPQQEITISYIWNTHIPSADTGNGYPNLYAAVVNSSGTQFMNSRNSHAFLGFPIGTVKLAGIDVQPDENEYVRLSLSYVYDYWGFLVQEPYAMPNGRVAYQVTTGAQPYTHPSDIDWVQTHPNDLVDHNKFITQLEEDWLVKGWVHYDDVVCAEPAVGSTATAITVEPAKALMDATAGTRVSTAP